jgi:hypothetical protein
MSSPPPPSSSYEINVPGFVASPLGLPGTSYEVNVPTPTVRCAGALLLFLIFLYFWVDGYNTLVCGEAPKADGTGDQSSTGSQCTGINILFIFVSGWIKVLVIALTILLTFFAFEVCVVGVVLKPLLEEPMGSAKPNKPYVPETVAVHMALSWFLDARMRDAMLAMAVTTCTFVLAATLWVEMRDSDYAERMVVARALYGFNLVSFVGALMWALH